MLLLMIPAVVYFNPRPHAGDDDQTGDQTVSPFISIHAPTRGTTYPELQVDDIGYISIHAPTRGTTAKRNKITKAFT